MIARQKIGQGKLVAAALLVDRRLQRFPTSPEVDGQMLRGAPRILHVGREYGLAHVIGEGVALIPPGHVSQQQVRQIVAGVAAGAAAAKRPLAVGLLIVRRVELLLSEVEAEGDLVPAFDLREVVRNLIVVDVEVSRRTGSTGYVEVVSYSNLHVVVRHIVSKRLALRVLDAQRLRTEQVGCRTAIVGSPVESGVEGVQSG